MKTKSVVKVAAIAVVAAGLMFVLSMPLWATHSYKNVLSETNITSVPNEVTELVAKELVNPLHVKYYGKDYDEKRMMSRCPSGVHANYKSTEANQDGFYHGTVNNWVGCSRKEVCKFRANSTKVEVEDNGGYIAANVWLNKPTAKQKSKGEI